MIITIPSGYANGELRIMVRHNGLIQVGHVRHPATHYYRAILWERAGQRRDDLDTDVEWNIARSTLTEVRQALRDRVRLQGKWWT